MNWSKTWYYTKAVCMYLLTALALATFNYYLWQI